MRILKHMLVTLALIAVPLLVAFPAGLPDPVADGTASPREVLAAQLLEAMRATEAGPLAGLPLSSALAAIAGLLGIAVWLVLRQRPRKPPARAARATRANQALELIRGGADPDDIVLRARLSRDAIEVLRHTAVG